MKGKFLKIAIFILLLLILQANTINAAFLGEQVAFNIDAEYAKPGLTNITATLQYVGDHAYFYAENNWWNALGGDKLNILKNLSYEFDKIIYPNLQSGIGSEWKPGIDGDERITILFTPIKDNAGGFFNTNDEYLKSIFADSNEREMIYLNASSFDSPRLRSFLTHEFQHLITFYQKDKVNSISDEIFLNEARSEYASTLAGYDNFFSGSNIEMRLKDFLKQPSNSLAEWKNQPEDYGSANLFMQYLMEHYGTALLNRMTLSPKVGIASIDDALSLGGFKERFADIFDDWAIALYLNDCRAGNAQRYCYLNDNIRNYLKSSLPPTSIYAFPPSGVSAMMVASLTKDWSPRWYKFTGGSQNLKIDFNGNVFTKFSVYYIINKFNGDSEVKKIDLNTNQQGTVYVANLGTDVASVILTPISHAKLSGFNSDEAYYSFSYAATIISEIPNPTPDPDTNPVIINPPYSDGSLIRAKGDAKVYVTNGKYKRWIQSPYIFNSYGHLRWENIIEATPEEVNWYENAWLVRAFGDYKVYEINSDGTKHWINMTALQFTNSGRKWDMVSVINVAERDWYRMGGDVKI